MKHILISNDHIQAQILPDFGGTVAHLWIDGTDVLRMNEGMLGLSNTLAGGIPVLFPFVSATAGNEAEFEGQRYTMPMHGFAKDLPFGTVRQAPHECEIRLRSCAITRAYYPYDFELTLIYEIVEDGLRTALRVKNTGARPLPFAAGFHPFFLTPKREKTIFSFGMKEYWNYLRPNDAGMPEHGRQSGALSLADQHDTVFFNGSADCELICMEPAYRARLECSADFSALTICTTQENASCIEPWQARPGAAHDLSEARWAQPGETHESVYTIHLSNSQKLPACPDLQSSGFDN